METINVGASPGDHTGDLWRDAMIKTNSNFAELAGLDAAKGGLVSLSANATETVIATISTPVAITGTWQTEESASFSTDATGKMTYTGTATVGFAVDANAAIEAAGGTNKDIRAYLAVNGAIVARSGRTAKVGAGDPSNVSIPWFVELAPNDYLQFFAENNTDTTNLIAIDAALRVIG